MDYKKLSYEALQRVSVSTTWTDDAIKRVADYLESALQNTSSNSAVEEVCLMGRIKQKAGCDMVVKTFNDDVINRLINQAEPELSKYIKAQKSVIENGKKLTSKAVSKIKNLQAENDRLREQLNNISVVCKSCNAEFTPDADNILM